MTQVLFGAASIAIEGDGYRHPLGNVGVLRRKWCVDQLIESLICGVLDLAVFADPEAAATTRE